MKAYNRNLRIRTDVCSVFEETFIKQRLPLLITLMSKKISFVLPRFRPRCTRTNWGIQLIALTDQGHIQQRNMEKRLKLVSLITVIPLTNKHE